MNSRSVLTSRPPAGTVGKSHSWLAAALLLVTGSAPAQEALRSSLAGEAAAMARRQAQANRPYSVRTGDLKMLIEPSLSLEWNDNVSVSDAQSQEDFILKPLLRLGASYPVTQFNFLNLSVGVGYDKYFNHDEYSIFRLEPGSELSYDFYVKDLWINVHDRFQYIQDPALEAGISRTARYGGLYNTAGISGLWDLNDINLSLGYDHYNFVSANDQFEYLNRASEFPFGRAGFRVHPTLMLGVEATGSFTTYDQPLLNDSVGYSAGVYADWKLSQYFNVQPRAGYASYFFDQTSRVIPAEDQSAWYVGLGVSHRVNQVLTYSLNAGRELRLGIQADMIDAWYIRPSASWKLIRNVALNTFLNYEHGTQGRGNGALKEDYDWFGGGLGLNYQLMQKLTAGLNYRLTVRASDAARAEYTQNLVGLQFTYRF